jgi:hypothetical protein
MDRCVPQDSRTEGSHASPVEEQTATDVTRPHAAQTRSSTRPDMIARNIRRSLRPALVHPDDARSKGGAQQYGHSEIFVGKAHNGCDGYPCTTEIQRSTAVGPVWLIGGRDLRNSEHPV